MSNTRIYVDMPLATGEEFALGAAPANHLSNVLRMGEGAPVTLFNGSGGEYHGCLTVVRKKKCAGDARYV